MTSRVALCCCVLGFVLDVSGIVVADEPALKPLDVQHVAVYDVDGRFGGWPANHGIWSWGNEILVGFSAGTYQDLGPERHNINHDLPEEHLLGRSKDGGQTWTISNPAKEQNGVLLGAAGMRHGKLPPGITEAEPIDCPGGIDFTNPNFAMTCRMSGIDEGVSRFYYSYDRGNTWKGPFKLPMFGQPGIAARTDYIVNGPHDCMLFLTASKANKREGRPICGRTTDGGKTWKFVSYIGEEPKGFGIMPSTVRLSPTELITTIRRRASADEPKHRWIAAWASHDNGQTWDALQDPVDDLGEGNPPHMIRLHDGRLCLTYGYRAKPFSIQAKLSEDGGKSWSAPIILRDDGGGRNLGYPRTVERPDGKIVTIYYFHDQTDRDRKIIATIWTPPARTTRNP